VMLPVHFYIINKSMTTITCKIPDKISTHLSALARQRRVPKSQIVREALAASFRKTKSKMSAFDLMQDVCGIVKGSPKNYASHRRHLKGFGECRDC
jgi:predicted DNA-binding protein